MKQTKLYSILVSILTLVFFTTTALAKDPVVVEINTNYKTVKEALIAAKTALMKQKFVPSGGMGESGFTATRTTGSKSDYYTADVMADKDGDIIKLTITFIKSGSGLLKLSKVAEEIKAELSASKETGSIQNPQRSSVVQSNSVQANQPSELNYMKYKKLKKAGIALTIGGGGAILTGLIIYAGAGYGGGQYLAALGTMAVGAGIPLAIVGSKKVKESCVSFQLNYHVNSIGVAMVF